MSFHPAFVVIHPVPLHAFFCEIVFFPKPPRRDVQVGGDADDNGARHDVDYEEIPDFEIDVHNVLRGFTV
jgi:hypothetical protein